MKTTSPLMSSLAALRVSDPDLRLRRPDHHQPPRHSRSSPKKRVRPPKHDHDDYDDNEDDGVDDNDDYDDNDVDDDEAGTN